jgi:elongation factor Ts
MADKNTIELIKALRERTGAGMMDCKHALEENAYDIEKAVDWLREKGIVKQAKRANRTAAEGLTRVKVCPKCGKAAFIEVNCETDFVSAAAISSSP